MSTDAKHKALSFQQPWATFIAGGIKTVECRSRKVKTPIKDLVVCASKTPRMYDPIPGMMYGYAIGLVDVVDCAPFVEQHLEGALMGSVPEGQYAWILENPRFIMPFKVSATASFFYVDHEIEVIPTTLDSYESMIESVGCVEGTQDEIEDLTIRPLFGNDPSWVWKVYCLDGASLRSVA